MNKKDFLARLRIGLGKLPQSDIDERLNFYSEMIDDRVEEGLSEEEAVKEIGPINLVVAQIIADYSSAGSNKAKTKTRRELKPLEIVLIVLGSPIWVSLLIAAFSVIISIYAVLWSVIIALWSVFFSLAACFLGGLAAAAIFTLKGNPVTGLAVLGAALLLAGLSIFAFYGCLAASRGVVTLTKKSVIWIKSLFIKKEAAQ
ncbi:MAG: DUF1700 domain-containing protein [Clostridia bacterium]|nr:DUF1700 domain-containing protein [Clostridia bacterium]